MLQDVLNEAVKGVMGGVTPNLPKPLIGGTMKVSITLEIVDGKPVFKEGSAIQIDLDLNMGGNG